MARLAPILSKDQVAPEYQAAAADIASAHGSLQGPYSVLLHAPEIAKRLAVTGTYIRFETKLDERVKNLAALTTAREFDCQYVWGAQAGAARRRGIPESTIDAIRAKSTRGTSAEDAAVVGFTQRLIREHRLDDATVQSLRDRLGDNDFIELTSVIGYYSMLSMSLNAVELEPGPGAEVLQR